jgi:hypothetical protein
MSMFHFTENVQMTSEVPHNFIITTLDHSVKSGGPYTISESTIATAIPVLKNRPTLVEEEQGKPYPT